MVNTGKPSAGCYLCRARRVRCDGLKPHCMRCQRIGQTCPGYRDPRFPNFRDETVSTITKAIKKTVTSQEKADRSRQTGENDVRELWGAGTMIGPQQAYLSRQGQEVEYGFPTSSAAMYAWHGDPQSPPVTPIEQQAACCFMSNHVLVPSKPGGRGEYAFVYHTIKSGAVEPWFAASFRAASLAALACRPPYRRLMSLAHANYTKAIGAVNKAVQTPGAAMSDQTLGAVLLLAMYETLACPSKKLNAFEAHIRGAVELVKLRGPGQVEDPVGCEMFILARTRMIMLQSTFGGRSRSTDGSGWGPNNEILNRSSNSDTMGQLGTWMMRKREIDFKADKWLGTQNPTATPEEVRIKIAELLADAETAAQTMCALASERCPAHLRPIVIWRRETADPGATPVVDADFPGDFAYSFHDHWMAAFHKTCYGTILHFSQTMAQCVEYLAAPEDPRERAEYKRAKELAERAIADLLASSHYFTKCDGEDAGLGDSQTVGQDQQGALSGLRAVYVVTIPVITTLYKAMTSEFTTPAQRAYLRKKLQFIAEEGGLGQAEALLRLGP